MKQLLSFSSFCNESATVLNECLQPLSDAFGVYDFSNENHEILNDVLKLVGCEWSYDPLHNKTEVQTADADKLVELLKQNNFKMIKTSYDVKDDCLQIALSSAGLQNNIKNSMTMRSPFGI